MTALLISPLLSAAPASAQQDEAHPRIVTHNAFLLPKALYPNWGQDVRADLTVRDGLLSGQDVVVLQELFENSSAERLRAGLAEEYPLEWVEFLAGQVGLPASRRVSVINADVSTVTAASMWSPGRTQIARPLLNLRPAGRQAAHPGAEPAARSRAGSPSVILHNSLLHEAGFRVFDGFASSFWQ